MALAVTHTIFDAAKVFVPDVYEDDRGFFKEVYATHRYSEAGVSDTFLQDSVSYSTKNVIRGLHYDSAMSKFVQVLRGRVWDVIVDLREGSSTYRRWQGFNLSEFNHKQLYVPAGFAHGFLALSDDVVVFYKQGALYDPSRERAVRWNDPTLAIEWPLVGEPRVSLKDQAAPFL
jgi:dTDP-4-dehydrorhamnose 3,5-epimerase